MRMFQQSSTGVAEQLQTSEWRLAAVDGPLPESLRGATVAATVPGCVHTDLLRAGLIPDPYLDENEAALQWIGRTRWRYSTTLSVGAAGPGERVELVFEGLDTACQVRWNDHVLGTATNMHRTHRFDITDLVGAGDGELAVEFSAQLDAAERASEALTPRVRNYPHPFNALRKMACNFGWDWGPALVTAGIWRPVRLRRWTTGRLDAVRPLVTVGQNPAGVTTGRVSLHATTVRTEPGPLRARVTVTGHGADAAVEATFTSDRVVVDLDVPGVQQWWPRHYGAQPLYDLTVTLSAEDGTELDRYHRRIGFRTVELDTAPDQQGTPFTFVVNDRPILVKGANWIPDDCFPSRVDRARYVRSIGDAVDANMNLLRVWGGGIYESDDFYDVCDRQGILVWQDFLFACAAYAEEPPLSDEVVAEATEAITRLSAHPSLVLWNGNNENLWGHEDWGWREQLGDLTWGQGYYLDVLPRLVAGLDPTRPYSPGSPWSFEESRHPNDPDHGTMHIWDVWNSRDYTAYRDYVPRFVSEFGYQGPPTWATLTDAIHDSPRTPDSPGMLAHQKAADGNAKLARGIAPHLDIPGDFEDWHWAMSVQQARAVSFGVEHFRSWQPRCMGTIVWQLNDCWPVTSWAAVDGEGRRKPLWYALRHAYADRLLTIQPRGSGLALVACNDTDEAWDEPVRVRRITFDGLERATITTTISAPPRGVATVQLEGSLVAGVAPRDEVIVADSTATRALWFFDEDRSLRLTDRWQAASVSPVLDGYAVHLTAESLQRDVCLLVDKVDPDASVDEMMVTVLPGESRTFLVRTSKPVDPQRFLDSAVLRSVNQLVHP